MAKTVGLLTYHGLHNYGAMLQAFALQKIIEDIGYKCEIINFRTNKQKKRYQPVFKTDCSFLEGLAKMIFFAPYKSDILKKYDLFEGFMRNDMELSSKRYSSLQELNEDIPEYDYYISGSDQIWNPYGPSFDWAYFLPFVKERGVRIAYAPSMVQKPADNLDKEIKDKIRTLLGKYDHISVREEESRINIFKISGINPEVVLDPTFLVKKNQWKKFINNDNLVFEGNYLFYYSPYFNRDALEITHRLARYLNLKVVTSIAHSATFMVKYPDFIKKLAVGPKEFLYLCNNAKIICGHSLHLAAFSIILQKPFYIVNGLDNKRVSHLLNITGLGNRSIVMEELNKKQKDAFDIDYNEVNKLITDHKNRSINFLTKSLR
jgi:hypothetical protein